MAIDFDALRDDLETELGAQFYGAGIGTALMDSFAAQDASDEELISMAEDNGLDVSDYDF